MALSAYTLEIGDYLSHRAANDLLVDLRTPETYQRGTIPGAVNVPAEEETALLALPKDRRIILFCHKGETSEEILPLMRQAGFDAYHIAGGYRQYHRHQLLTGFMEAGGPVDG